MESLNNLRIFFINHNMEEDIQDLQKIEKRAQEKTKNTT